ncbi:MAG: diguanylate cyclase [Henriciella sp.]|nr:diguanylate cyclase [Henriciella sp.]
MLKFWKLISIVVFFTAGFPMTGLAQSIGLNDQTCALANDGTVSIADALAAPASFDCDKGKFETPARHYWVKADIEAAATAITDPVLRVRIARHGDLTLRVEYHDAEPRLFHYTSDDIKANWRGPSHTAFQLTGPNGEPPVSLLLGVERPWDPWNLADLTLWESAEDKALDARTYLSDAVFSAMLLAPFVLHLVFWFLLRIRFIMFHLIGIAAMLVTQILWGGIIFDIIPAMTIELRSILAHMSIAILTCMACLLIRDLCEPDKLGRFAHKALLWAGITPLVLTSAVLLISPGLPVYGSLIFHFGILIAVVACVGSLILAAFRKSWIARALLLGTSGFVMIAIMRILNSTGLFVGLPTFDFEFYAAAFIDSIIMSVVVVHRALLLRKERDVAMTENALLFKTSRTDVLTGLLNRRALHEAFTELTEQPERRRKIWSLVAFDIDHFKSINDEYGHDVGDLCLQQFSAILKRKCRSGDSCARFGGEEFIVLVATDSRSEVLNFAERIRTATENETFGDADRIVSAMTVSIGISYIPRSGPVSFEEVYKKADQALYRAKSDGRNRVMIANSAVESALDKLSLSA